MFGPKCTATEIIFFGIVGIRLLASAELSGPAPISSIHPRRKLAVKYSSNSREMVPTPSRIHIDTNKFTNVMAAIPSRQKKTQLFVRSIRAGGIDKNKKQAASDTSSSILQQQRSEKLKKTLILLTSSIALYSAFYTRSTWMSLFNKEKLQASVVESLENLNSFPYLYSRLFYTISMALWETLGMSTIPVETAAGMVFGWSGFYWSGIGKLLGACLAFGLGRGALSSFVEKKLSSNTFLNLVQTSTQDNPLLVVTLMKMSCFPETVKNFGSSVLKPIRWWMFILGTAVHGWTFTALWTYLGVDTAARLKDTEGLLPPDQRLKILLTLALINGCVISPLSMAYWVRTLKQKQGNSATKRMKS